MTQQVITKNNKRRNGIIAVVAGIALLMGAGTFATWTSSYAGTPPSGFTNGEMTVGKNGDIKVWDVTPNTVAHDITNDLATWKGSPQDQIQIDFPFVVSMVGDNLNAELELQGLPAGTFIKVIDGDGTVKDITSYKPGDKIKLSADDADHYTGGIRKPGYLGVGADGKVEFTVQATFTINDEVDEVNQNSSSVFASGSIQQISATLSQVLN